MEVQVLDRIKIGLNYLLPKKCLTELMGWFANKNLRWLTKIMIDIFVWYYNVNMKEAKYAEISNYKNFNDFFARSLHEKARPIDQNTSILVHPVDGIISQLGNIQNDIIVQAKNHSYSLEALLAGDYKMAKKFINGKFINFYLEPASYHRVHMPYNGVLRQMIYVPGDLYSVNSLIAKNVPNLFARNERVICLFDSDFGPFVQIMIGALIVGSIETIWHGQVTPPRNGIIKRWSWPKFYNNYSNQDNNVILLKGQEMGKFKFGSTVINLFANKVQILDNLSKSSRTFFGQPLARILN